MNELVRVEPIAAPAHMGLVPSSMGEAMKLAEMMAAAKLVPAALQKSPADCLMVIQQAVRWNMDPFAVAQECSVIQGKLMHSGKLVAAVVNARGSLTQRLAFSYSGAGDDRTILVSGVLQGEAEPRTVTVKLKDARTQNRVWQTQPDQQLMYHGTRVWARRHTPELMLGVWSPEEFDESPAVTRRPAPPAANVMVPHDQETGEVIDPAGDAAGAPATEQPKVTVAGAQRIPSWEEYVDRWAVIVTEATDARHLHDTWTKDKGLRNMIEWPEDEGAAFNDIKARVEAKIKALKK